MGESTYHEIDEPSDWLIVEHLLIDKYSRMGKLNIVLPEIKKFNTLDGMGFNILKENGILTGIITGEKKELNRRRAEKLNLDIYKEGIKDKLYIVKELCKKYKISLENVAYLGDDINDLEAISTVGFGCSVPNGIEEVKKRAVYVTNKIRGHGAVRKIIDIIVKGY